MTVEVSGLIPVWKPRGITSKDVSRIITKKFGRLKIGHVGTLDPDADGVLPILIGRATKLQDYLLKLDKAYSFDLILGEATDTLDATGQTIASRPWAHVTLEQIQALPKQFLGTIDQIPPLYSAVKYQGRELYKYARDNSGTQEIPLETLTRKVLIKSLSIDHVDLPKITMTVHCGKGTYVRTLAADFADKLGTVGHVNRLTRILSAGIQQQDCVSLEKLRNADLPLEKCLIPLGELSFGLPEWVCDDMVLIRRITDGQRVILPFDRQDFAETGTSGFEVLLRGQNRECVGIINFEPLPSGQFKLHMKRGI